MEGWTHNRQADRGMNIQTGRQRDEQTDIQADRQTDIQTEKYENEKWETEREIYTRGRNKDTNRERGTCKQ